MWSDDVQRDYKRRLRNKTNARAISAIAAIPAATPIPAFKPVVSVVSFDFETVEFEAELVFEEEAEAVEDALDDENGVDAVVLGADGTPAVVAPEVSTALVDTPLELPIGEAKSDVEVTLRMGAPRVPGVTIP